MTTGDGSARPVIGEPVVCAVVVHRDAPERLRACLEALAEAMTVALEIVVVDDGSRPEARADVRSRRGLSTLANETPRGFAAAANQGAAVARAPFVLFLDAGLRLEGAAVARLHAAMAADTRLAVVATSVARRRRRGLERLVRSALERARASLARMRRRADAARAAAPLPVACGAAGALIVRANVFRAVGGFDERLESMDFDEDFFRRVRRRGYRIAAVRDVAVGGGPQRSVPRAAPADDRPWTLVRRSGEMVPR